MNISATKPQTDLIEFLAPLFSAFLIVMFLFFIDEGYYDFRWMADAGNWFVFCIYLSIFFLLQWLISHFLFRRVTGWKKILVMAIVAVPVIIGFLWLVQ